MREGVLQIRLAAPPVDGEANAELLRTLGAALRIPRRDIRIVRGLASRNKVLDIDADESSVNAMLAKIARS
jgi:uncharacterized protein YggU (UPF0235/DUF167 family)